VLHRFSKSPDMAGDHVVDLFKVFFVHFEMILID
jgi:hypothetical protein